MAGIEDPEMVEVRSLQPGGPLSRVTLNRDQVHHPHAMLALRVNGVDLSLDHGFPARIMVPAIPGVHCTKWVKGLRFA
jgi:DMSO/TMAO reductase YedYZ molybdopterin-dependent catalytic subunit